MIIHLFPSCNNDKAIFSFFFSFLRVLLPFSYTLCSFISAKADGDWPITIIHADDFSSSKSKFFLVFVSKYRPKKQTDLIDD